MYTVAGRHNTHYTYGEEKERIKTHLIKTRNKTKHLVEELQNYILCYYGNDSMVMAMMRENAMYSMNDCIKFS